MKSLIAKIWVPALLVLVAAAQSFGIDTGRAIRLQKVCDSLLVTMTDSLRADSVIVDSLRIDSLRIDSLKIDSLRTDSLPSDTLVKIMARDTIVVPDSLKETNHSFSNTTSQSRIRRQEPKSGTR